MRVRTYDALETLNYYVLFQIGLSWKDIQEIPANIGERLLLLHNVIKEEEERELKKSQKKVR